MLQFSLNELPSGLLQKALANVQVLLDPAHKFKKQQQRTEARLVTDELSTFFGRADALGRDNDAEIGAGPGRVRRGVRRGLEQHAGSVGQK